MSSPLAPSPIALRNPLMAAMLAVLSIVFSASFWTPSAMAQAGAAAKPAPDVLIFTNGDQLTGKLVRGVGGSIVFSSDMAGEITVPLDKVKEVRSATTFAVLRQGTNLTRVKVTPSPIEVADGKITVKSTSGAPEVIPSKELAYVIDADTYNKEINGHQGFTQGWNGAVTGGITLVQATNYGSTFTAGINLIRSMPSVPWLPRRDRTLFNLIETYGKLTQPVIPQTNPPTPDSVAKTNIFHTDIEQDRYFTPRFYVLAIAAFDHNFSQGLDFQQLYGGGVGWTLIDSPVQHFDINGNIHYMRQQFFIAAITRTSSAPPSAKTISATFPTRSSSPSRPTSCPPLTTPTPTRQTSPPAWLFPSTTASASSSTPATTT